MKSSVVLCYGSPTTQAISNLLLRIRRPFANLMRLTSLLSKSLDMLPHDLPLNPLEQFIHDLHDRCQATGVATAVARVRGRVDPGTLQRALRALQRRHPLLRASLSRRGRSYSYNVWESPPPIPLEVIETDDRERWRTEMVERSRTPFDAAVAPFMRVSLLQGRDGTWCDVLLTLHHLIADGRGVMTILRDVQSFWAAAGTGEPEVEPLPFTPPHLPAQKISWGATWRELASFVTARRARRGIPLVRFDNLNPPAMNGRREVLTADETTQLRAACRRQETSLYGALSAATLQALALDPKHVRHRFRVDTPADFRLLCEPRISPEQVSCCVWILGYHVPPPAQFPFWELARRCRQEVDVSHLMTGRIQRGWEQLSWLMRFSNARRAEALRWRFDTGLVSINDLGAARTIPGGKGFAIEEFGWYSNREHTVPTFVVNSVMIDGRLNLTFISPSHTVEQLSAVATTIRDALTQQSNPTLVKAA